MHETRHTIGDTWHGAQVPVAPRRGVNHPMATRRTATPLTSARRAMARRTGRRNGQSLVEFAVVLPLFLLIVAGVADLGMLLYSNMTAINAAREGARLSVTDPGDLSAVEARVRAMSAGLDQSDLTITTSCEAPDSPPATTFHPCSAPMWQSGDAVVVKVDYVYHMIWPLAFGNQIPMTSTVTMRIE
jgi:Flp pilus assembly protein TadG